MIIARTLVILIVSTLINGCFSSSDDDNGLGDGNFGARSDLPTSEIEAHLGYLSDFHELAALIRFHHPSNGVHQTDWDRFLTEASYAIVTVDSDEDYVETVKHLFSDMAPMVRINQEKHGIEIEGADRYRVNLQSGYVDSALSEEARQQNVYRREQRDVDASVLLNDARYPHEKEFTYQSDFLRANIPLVIPLEAGSEALASHEFEDSETFRLPESVDHPMTCLSTVGTVWGVMRHFYPYFHEVDVDWRGKLRDMLAACEGGDPQTLYEGLQIALTPLKDNHFILRINGARHPVADHVAPVGLDDIEGDVVVTWLGRNAPEALSVGDRLLSIEGQLVEARIDALLPYALLAPNRARNQVITVDLLRGDQADSLDAEFMNPAGESFSVSLPTTEEPAQVYRANRAKLTESSLPQHTTLEDGLHYVNLSATGTEEVQETVEALGEADGVVLDLRTYPEEWMGWRGLLAHFSNHEISSAPMYYHYANWPEPELRHVEPIPQTLAPELPYLDMPTVVLASRYSVSQNEHALAYAQNADLPILGEPTFGINGNVTQILTFGGPGEGGLSLRFTGMEVRQNDESTLIGRGIQPDIEQPLTIEGLRDGQDVQLERAIDWLNEQLH